MFNCKTVILLVALAAAYVVVCGAEQGKYSDKYDFIDFRAILNNPRQRQEYYSCFVSTNIRNCKTADARFFYERLPEIITTGCRKCTAKQMQALDEISDFYTKSMKECYDAIIKIATERGTGKSLGPKESVAAPPSNKC